MEKRVLLAFFLSALVLAAWSFFFAPPKPGPDQQPGQSTEAQNQPPASNEAVEPGINHRASQPSSLEPETTAQPESGTPLPEHPQLPGRLIRVETPIYRAVFSNRGAVAVSWSIKRLTTGPRREIHGDDGKEIELIPQSQQVLQALGSPFGLVTADQQLTNLLNTTSYDVSETDDVIVLRESESRELVFSLQRPDLDIQKRFVFHGDRFDLSYTVEADRGNQPLAVATILGPNFGDQSVMETGRYTPGPQLIADVDDGIERILADKPSTEELTGRINWVGVEDNYFALALVPSGTLDQVYIRTGLHTVDLNGVNTEKHFIAALAPTPLGEEHTIFAGPKIPQVLARVGQRVGKRSFELIISYGFLSSIFKPIINYILSPALTFTYRFIPNYGVVILLVTFVINMLFFPLKRKGSVKMKKAQAMQPKMKKLQQKLKDLKKDDPEFQKLQTEQVRLMREANPLGGCMPMLAQMPFFWAFFILLTVSFDVRHAPFVGWINNLSAPDKLFIGGTEIHVLPIAMCVSWMAQSFLTPGMSGTDPSQQAQQKVQKLLMGLVMPVVFTVFFFWQAPSGLVLYWMFNSLVGAGQQLIINRSIHQAAPEAPVEKSGKALKKKKQIKAVSN